MGTPLRNWAGNHTYRAAELLRPTSLEELRDVVRAAERLHVLGSRHCFNDIADAPVLVSLDGMPHLLELDTAARTVRLSGGMRYGTLAAALHERGWAVHNLASLPHISVAGAIATATHGSGDRHRNLAGAVAGMQLLTSDGEVREIVRGDPDLDGVVVSLGTLGVVTEVTLEIEPTYDVVQRVDTGLPWDQALPNLAEILAGADSVSLFTDWRGPVLGQVWRKDRVGSGRADPRRFGAAAATTEMHPISSVDPVNTTAQLGVAGPWHERLPHFRMGFTPSSGEELQTEYFVGREDATGALEAVRAMAEEVSEVLLISEVRTVARDELWLSTAQGRDTVGLHFTWQPRQADVEALLPRLEQALLPFAPRPHWGKLFTAAVAGRPDRLEALYPHLPDFRALAARLDPRGAFLNDFVLRHGLR